MCEIQFLYSLRCIPETTPDHHVLMKILVAMAHAADVQRNLRLHLRQRTLHVAVHSDVHRGLDCEVAQALTVAGATETLLEPGQIFGQRSWHETQRQPAVRDFRCQLHGRFVSGAEIDRDVGIHMQDGFQRLADAERALTGVRQAYLTPFMCHRRFTSEDLPHDRDVVLVAVVRPAPWLAVPTLNDLRSRYTEPGDETSAARHRIDGGSAHRGIGGRTGSELHDAGAQFDPLRQRGEIGQRCDCIRAIRLRCPYAVIAKLLGALHERHGDFQMRARITDG